MCACKYTVKTEKQHIKYKDIFSHRAHSDFGALIYEPAYLQGGFLGKLIQKMVKYALTIMKTVATNLSEKSTIELYSVRT